MYTRHREVPVFERRNGVLEAAAFNRVQVALNRLGDGQRLVLPGLKTLDLILQRDAWIIVDRAFNDVPVAAWTDFEVHHREALHAPVRCHILLFHANGGVVLKRALEAMHTILGEQLEAGLGRKRVLDFPAKE